MIFPAPNLDNLKPTTDIVVGISATDAKICKVLFTHGDQVVANRDFSYYAHHDFHKGHILLTSEWKPFNWGAPQWQAFVTESLAALNKDEDGEDTNFSDFVYDLLQGQKYEFLEFGTIYELFADNLAQALLEQKDVVGYITDVLVRENAALDPDEVPSVGSKEWKRRNQEARYDR